MAKVKVLIDGYLSSDSGGRTCPTVSLVQDKGLNIVVDPGTVKDPQLIVDELAKLNLHPDDINMVFLTHGHYDHFKNTALFKNARGLDYWGIWDNDLNRETDGQITPNITIINTPGHSYDSMTMLVKTAKGTVAIVGDLVYNKSFLLKENLLDDGEIEMNQRKIIQLADIVIPGHGPLFKLEAK